jgi:hypothetical protein
MARPSKDDVQFVMQQAKCDEHTAKTWIKANKGNAAQAVIQARDDVALTALGNRGGAITAAEIADRCSF